VQSGRAYESCSARIAVTPCERVLFQGPLHSAICNLVQCGVFWRFCLDDTCALCSLPSVLCIHLLQCFSHPALCPGCMWGCPSMHSCACWDVQCCLCFVCVCVCLEFYVNFDPHSCSASAYLLVRAAIVSLFEPCQLWGAVLDRCRGVIQLVVQSICIQDHWPFACAYLDFRHLVVLRCSLGSWVSCPHPNSPLWLELSSLPFPPQKNNNRGTGLNTIFGGWQVEMAASDGIDVRGLMYW
jgi:hypothetical protein